MRAELLLAGACALVACGAPVDLLHGRAPISVTGVSRAEVLDDGVAVANDEWWNTQRTAVFDCTSGQVTWDLGEPRPVRAAWLHGDNNDTYALSISDDGATFRPLWTAPLHHRPGMQPRFTSELREHGRYLRATANGGDGSCALSEVLVYAEVPGTFPPAPTVRMGFTLPEQARSRMLLFALALVAFVVLSFQRGPKWTWALAALPAVAGYQLVVALHEAWPVDGREVAMARGVTGAMAGAIVLWEVFAPRAFAPRRGAVVSALLLSGVCGVLCFYNLGRGQFFDERRHAQSFLHVLDLRQYYSTAKYFPQLGYTAMYEADVAAFAEDTGASLDALAGQPVRDLTTNQPKNVAQLRGRIEAVKGRFTPERWESYRRDARFFRETMGERGWLETLVDLGGNATPLWITICYLFFNALDTSYESMRLLALLDPLLLLAMFISIGRCFGLRTLGVVMTVFGANDFVMFGSNWAGAVLRHDWLAWLGLAACALRKERWVLAGVFFGLSVSIRAFPAWAVIGLTLPALWWWAEKWRAERRRPALRELWEKQRSTVLVAVSSVATVAAAIVITSIVLGPGAWPAWLQKVSLLNAEIHLNPVSLKTAIAGNDESRWRLLEARQPLYLAAAATFMVLVVLAARGKRLEQAAMLGMVALPTLMMPANYYLHVVCLLPLMAIDRTGERGAGEPPVEEADGWVFAVLLAICGVQYLTTRVDMGLHFHLASLLLMSGLAAILIAIVRRDWRQHPARA